MDKKSHPYKTVECYFYQCPNFNGFRLKAVEVRAWMSNYIPHKAVEVRAWMSNYIPHKVVEVRAWMSNNIPHKGRRS